MVNLYSIIVLELTVLAPRALKSFCEITQCLFVACQTSQTSIARAHSTPLYCKNSEYSIIVRVSQYSIVLRDFTVLQRTAKTSSTQPSCEIHSVNFYQRVTYSYFTETLQKLHRVFTDSTETSLCRDSLQTLQRLQRFYKRLFTGSPET